MKIAWPLLCRWPGEMEEDLKVMVGHFVEVCKRKGLKINADESRMMVIGGEEGLV